MTTHTCTAFAGPHRVAGGALADVAVAVNAALAADPNQTILVFDDDTGQPVELDLRGSDAEVRARLVEPEADGAPRGRGRPKLGVVGREITLLPRHWDWLAAQPGGASVALRKLIDAARASGDNTEQIRAAQEAAGRVMLALAGDLPGYEEASRALYARDGQRFAEMIGDWPADVRGYVKMLAGGAFA